MDCLKLPSSLQRFSRNGKIVLINPEVPAWIVTNEVGEAIMSLFDGEHTVAEVVEISTEALGVDKRKRIEIFVDYAVNSRLFDTHPQAAPHRQELSNVHLTLTNLCNLRCKYCYAAERRETAESLLTLDDYQHLIDDICDINPQVGFSLTGGEPLLNANFFDIARMIKRRGNYVMVLSNGTLFSSDKCREMKGLVDLVTLSIDGSTAESHERTRGDNYNKVISAIDLLEHYGIDYTLSMTVTRLNTDQVEPLAKRYGRRLTFQPLFPVSDVAESTLAISGDEYYRVLKAAAGVNPLAYCESSLKASRRSPCYKCAIADGEFSIAPNGDVYPCQLLHLPQYLCGNVKNQSIAEIYNRSEVMRQLRRLTVDAIDKCRGCAIKYICGGACRARNHYVSGDITRPGDFCNYEFEAYLDGITTIQCCDLIGD